MHRVSGSNLVNSTQIEESAHHTVVVHMLIRSEDRSHILLLKRMNTGLMDGHYTLPGGHVRLRERFEHAAVRETHEEVGVEVQDAQPICLLPYSGGLNLVFGTSHWFGEPCNREPDKCSEVIWSPVIDLPNPTVPWLKHVLAMDGSLDWYLDLST